MKGTYTIKSLNCYIIEHREHKDTFSGVSVKFDSSNALIFNFQLILVQESKILLEQQWPSKHKYSHFQVSKFKSFSSLL